MIHGMMMPRSMLGIDEVNLLRALEHSGYVVVEVPVLIIVCRMSTTEMRRSAQLLIEARLAHEIAAFAQEEQEKQVAAAQEQAAARAKTILRDFQSIGNDIDHSAEQTRQVPDLGTALEASSRLHAQSKQL
ncbi:MAG: hypothetical protein ACI91B_001653, partial [Planctomycetota bacterium]